MLFGEAMPFRFRITFVALLLSVLSIELAQADGLYISEVAANYRREKGAAWVELVNNSGQAIKLNKYKLRSWGLNISGDTYVKSAQPITFDLPDVDIPARKYLVIAGKMRYDLNSSPRSIYIIDGQNNVPYWTDAGGFVELLDAEGKATVDFVRFGRDNTVPITRGSWKGASVGPFDAVRNYVFNELTPDPLDNYDQSIVRLTGRFKTTGTKNDWTHVRFPTPGGPNDIQADAKDSDNDGIPDSAKKQGGTFAGLDLFGMGAKPRQRDLFIHVDYLKDNSNNPDVAITPRIEALQKVRDAFLSHDIHVHFDVGNLFCANTEPCMNGVDPQRFNLSGNISHDKAFRYCTGFPGAMPQNCSSIYEYSSSLLDLRRKPIFRYLLIGYSQDPSNPNDSSGRAELPGNKFLVTLGGLGLSTTSDRDTRKLINYQAGTIMHELGHTLGLGHGGFEHCNCKPNYLSVMNYLYQLSGLPLNPRGMGPTERYYDQKGHGQLDDCSVTDGACDATFKIDYSNGSGRQLNEARLEERLNIGRGSDGIVGRSFPNWYFKWSKTSGDLPNTQSFGDWNLNEKLDIDLQTNGNLIGDQFDCSTLQNFRHNFQSLRDHDDWRGIILKTDRSYPERLRDIHLTCNWGEQSPSALVLVQSTEKSFHFDGKLTAPQLIREAQIKNHMLELELEHEKVKVSPWSSLLPPEEKLKGQYIDEKHQPGPRGSLNSIFIRNSPDAQRPWLIMSTGPLDVQVRPGYHLRQNSDGHVGIVGSSGDFQRVDAGTTTAFTDLEGHPWVFGLLKVSVARHVPGLSDDSRSRADWYLCGDMQHCQMPAPR